MIFSRRRPTADFDGLRREMGGLFYRHLAPDISLRRIDRLKLRIVRRSRAEKSN